MRKLSLLFFSLFAFMFSFSQVHVGLFGGIANYQGDLVNGLYIGRLTKPAVGITAGYELSDRLLIRGGLTFAKVAGSDKYNSKDYLKLRNLSFQTGVTEFSLAGEFYTFNMYEKRWSPYVFAGLAVFRFNPYTFDSTNSKVYLRPLSTEGQGLPTYPKSRTYSRTQLAIPFGGGIKYAINDNLRIGLEVGLRKLFTDYFDDISTNYADASDLLAARGPQAVALAYRGDEVPGGDPAYPAKGSQRGSAAQKDWYYLTGLTLTYRLGNGSLFNGGGGKRSRFGCPSNPL
jgi:hypothetical protein